MQEKKALETMKKLEEIYENIAPEFSASRQTTGKEFETFEPYIKNGETILDLGCGNGRFIKFLEPLSKKKKESYHYIGIDNSPSLLQLARKNHPSSTFIHGNQLNIPLKNETIDTLANIRAFHHIPSKKLQLKALQEMKRVLKKDGTLIITVWNLYQNKYKKERMASKWRSLMSFGRYNSQDLLIPWANKGNRYYYAFRPHELQKIVTLAGFQVIDFFGVRDGEKCEFKKAQDFIIIAKNRLGISVLDIPFDRITLEEVSNLALKKAIHARERSFFIATPNPEMLLEANKNPEFKKILQNTNLNIADGAGILLATRYLYKKKLLPERVTGTDLMVKICEKSGKNSHDKRIKIFLLGAADGVAKKARIVLEKKYHTYIAGTYSGSPSSHDEKSIIELINAKAPDILFVAFGAPKQEMWLNRNLHRMPTVKVAMGVGGAFDFIAGVRKRAPKIMQKLSLEWFYRLIIEPSRIKRMYNAVIRFPITVIIESRKKFTL